MQGWFDICKSIGMTRHLRGRREEHHRSVLLRQRATRPLSACPSLRRVRVLESGPTEGWVNGRSCSVPMPGCGQLRPEQALHFWAHLPRSSVFCADAYVLRPPSQARAVCCAIFSGPVFLKLQCAKECPGGLAKRQIPIKHSRKSVRAKECFSQAPWWSRSCRCEDLALSGQVFVLANAAVESLCSRCWLVDDFGVLPASLFLSGSRENIS